MSRNYFHIRDGNNLIRDEEGIELPSLEAAHTEAILVTREAVRLATLRGERIGMHGVFEIADQSGQTVLTLGFEAALDPCSTILTVDEFCARLERLNDGAARQPRRLIRRAALCARQMASRKITSGS
jgi:hypothetical protein